MLGWWFWGEDPCIPEAGPEPGDGSVLHGASGNDGAEMKARTFSGALCSANHEVPGSEDSSSESSSESESVGGRGDVFEERCERVRL